MENNASGKPIHGEANVRSRHAGLILIKLIVSQIIVLGMEPVWKLGVEIIVEQMPALVLIILLV